MDVLKMVLSRIRSNQSSGKFSLRMPLDQEVSLEDLAEAFSKILAEKNSKILRILREKKTSTKK